MGTSRTTNTMSEGLNGLLGSISEMKTMPDADLEFLIGLETTILKKVHDQYNVSTQQMAGEPGGMTPGGQPMPGPPMPPGVGGGMPPPMPGGFPMGAGGGARGLRTSPAAPNPDELRRMVGG